MDIRITYPPPAEGQTHWLLYVGGSEPIYGDDWIAWSSVAQLVAKVPITEAKGAQT